MSDWSWCRPGGCISSSKCSLCNYYSRGVGRIGRLWLPASPAPNRSVIQPCLFWPDYQHLCPNRTRQTLWWHSIWGPEHNTRRDRPAKQVLPLGLKASASLSLSQQILELWEQFHPQQFTRQFDKVTTTGGLVPGCTHTHIGNSRTSSCFSSASTNTNRGNGCLVVFVHQWPQVSAND